MVWFIFGFPLLVLAVEISAWFALVAFIPRVCLGIYSMSLRCPACRHQIVFGSGLIPLASRRRVVCGQSLTEVSKL